MEGRGGAREQPAEEQQLLADRARDEVGSDGAERAERAVLLGKLGQREAAAHVPQRLHRLLGSGVERRIDRAHRCGAAEGPPQAARALGRQALARQRDPLAAGDQPLQRRRKVSQHLRPAIHG